MARDREDLLKWEHIFDRIMDYHGKQTASRYFSAENANAVRSAIEGVLYELEDLPSIEIRVIQHDDKETGIYRKALSKWGHIAQTIIAFEEMAELQKELSKNLRGSNNVDAIAEEIADVEIMLAQMKLLHNCRTMVETVKAAKIKRLAERLANSDG